MAYEVTATRRRPQRFEDLIGQDFVVATLQKSIAAGKIAPAYLFSGPRGCGKTSSARILAKALNCEKGPAATPCGVCSACVEITRGSSLDVIEIDGASNTSVNDVRQIKDEVLFPPNSCRYKVYIIDEVHMLSTSAFNALLKTIEEPPPYVVFIFATTELHKVPATIKSRCQQFNFRLVSVDLLKESLGIAAQEAGIQADEEALFWLAREATGSVRDAYTLFDQVAAFSDGHITFEKIRDKLGLVGVDRINPLVEACADRDACAALTALDEILQAGVSVEQFTVDMADYFRNILLLASGVTRESLLGQAPERFSGKVRAAWSSTQIERALSLMLQLYRDLRYSLDPRYELELAVSRLSWVSDYVSATDVSDAIKRAQSVLLDGHRGADSTPPKVPAPRRDTGPFPDAGLVSGNPPEAARAEPQDAQAMADFEDHISDPFAALRQRLGSASEPCEPVQSEHASSPPEPIAPTPSALSTISFDILQESLVEYFQESKNIVATSLSQAFDWKDSGDVVSFAVDKPFVHNFLEQDHRLIADRASILLGRKVSLSILLAESRKTELSTPDSPRIPPQVELVRKIFHGTIAEEA